MQTKTTKKAQEGLRISTDKIDWAKGKLSDLRRTNLIDEDERIFPGWCATVLIVENDRRVVKPMRYQCRLAGKPAAAYDRLYPGTYNAPRQPGGILGRHVRQHPRHYRRQRVLRERQPPQG